MPSERQNQRNQLRSNPLLTEILTKADAEIVSQWRTAKSQAERESLHAEQAGLARFRELLEAEIRRNE